MTSNPDYTIRPGDIFFQMKSDGQWIEPNFTHTTHNRDGDQPEVWHSKEAAVVNVESVTCENDRPYRLAYRLKQGRVLYKRFRIKVEGCKK